MPKYRSITVHVTDRHGNALTEWGVQKLDRSKLTSCYIQSETDMAFRISIKPELPFAELKKQQEEEDNLPSMYGDVSDEDWNVRPSDVDGLGKKINLEALGQSMQQSPRIPEGPLSAGGRNEEYHAASLPSPSGEPSDSRRASPPQDHRREHDHRPQGHLIPRQERSPELPYHLLAVLRLDGRERYEKRSLVYLDPSHPDFFQPNGEVTMRSRCIKGTDGRVRACTWMFREVGIEIAFDKLFIASDEQVTPEKNEDNLVAALGGLGANGLADTEEKVQAGQITLTLERVTVGAVHRDGQWQPDHEQDEDVNMTANDASKVTHTSARSVAGKEKKHFPTVDFQFLEPGGPPFATFKFFYRSEDELRKYGFAGFPTVPTLATSPTTSAYNKAGRPADTGESANGVKKAKFELPLR